MTTTIAPPIEVRAKPTIVINWKSREQRKAERAARKAAKVTPAEYTILPEDGLATRTKKRAKLAGHTIAALFMKVANKVWSFTPVRWFIIALTIVSGFVFANVAITIASLIVALPFYMMELYLAGDIIFLSAAACMWWAVIYYTTGTAVDKGWV